MYLGREHGWREHIEEIMVVVFQNEIGDQGFMDWKNTEWRSLKEKAGTGKMEKSMNVSFSKGMDWGWENKLWWKKKSLEWLWYGNIKHEKDENWTQLS